MNFGISTFVTDEGIAPAVLSGAIEERGFDSLFIAEHTHIPLSRKSPWPRGGELPRRYYRTPAPFAALTPAAPAPHPTRRLPAPEAESCHAGTIAPSIPSWRSPPQPQRHNASCSALGWRW